MQTSKLYILILDNKRITLPLRDKKAFEVLRTALHRHHRTMVEIGGSSLSIIGIWNADAEKGTFYLGIKRNCQKEYTVEIVEETEKEEDAEIRRSLAPNSSKGDGFHYLPNSGSKGDFGSDLQREVQESTESESDGSSWIWQNSDHSRALD